MKSKKHNHNHNGSGNPNPGTNNNPNPPRDPQHPCLNPAAQSIFHSLTHGGCATNLFIPGDNPTEFGQLVDSYFTTHRPATDDHSAIVFDLAHARWMLWRRLRAQGNRENATYVSDPANWDAGHYHHLELMDRYVTQAQRAFQRALNNVRCVKKDAENSNHWRQQHALAQQKIRMAAEKHSAQMVLLKLKLDTALRHEKRRADAMQPLPPPPPPSDDEKYAPVYKETNGEETFIEQQFWLLNQKGKVIIEQVKPSNDEIRSVIANRDFYPVPPTYVVRCYEIEGPVPKDETWEFLEDGVWDDFDPALPNDHRVNYSMTFDEWRAEADEEDAKKLHPDPVDH